MTNKTISRKSPRSRPTPPKAPLLKTVLRSILKFFEEDLPVTEFRGPGKFDTEVAGVKIHQTALETLCGGRSPKAQKCVLPALITPVPCEKIMRVEIARTIVGQLKPADAKWLQKQLSAVHEGDCALKVSALIQGGRKKKNGPDEDFTVMLCLPPRPPKKTPALDQASSPTSQGKDGEDSE